MCSLESVESDTVTSCGPVRTDAELSPDLASLVDWDQVDPTKRVCDLLPFIARLRHNIELLKAALAKAGVPIAEDCIDDRLLHPVCGSPICTNPVCCTPDDEQSWSRPSSRRVLLFDNIGDNQERHPKLPDRKRQLPASQERRLVDEPEAVQQTKKEFNDVASQTFDFFMVDGSGSKQEQKRKLRDASTDMSDSEGRKRRRFLDEPEDIVERKRRFRDATTQLPVENSGIMTHSLCGNKQNKKRKFVSRETQPELPQKEFNDVASQTFDFFMVDGSGSKQEQKRKLRDASTDMSDSEGRKRRRFLDEPEDIVERKRRFRDATTQLPVENSGIMTHSLCGNKQENKKRKVDTGETQPELPRVHSKDRKKKTAPSMRINLLKRRALMAWGAKKTDGCCKDNCIVSSALSRLRRLRADYD